MIKERVQNDMKTSLKAGDKRKLGVIRLIMAAIKQREVDERVELADQQVLSVLDKMVKQRRESKRQYEQAGRTDLADQEAYEIGIIQDYLPEALSDSDITALIDEAISGCGATSLRDMGKVMGQLKPKMQGRANMAAVSAIVKKRLTG